MAETIPNKSGIAITAVGLPTRLCFRWRFTVFNLVPPATLKHETNHVIGFLDKQAKLLASRKAFASSIRE
ncbi:hypothetical protein J6590_056083 [Homalodisca vitripennis]|nr:hypothetical protein J6590_056083 [Homalodisca vitripennis]